MVTPWRHGFVPSRLNRRACKLDASPAEPRPELSQDCLQTKTNKKDIVVAAKESQNVQDVFLNHVRKNKTAVTVFLVNGVKLQGIITWFDNFSVLLRRDGHTQLVYKHAISTVMPGAPIQLFDGTKAEGASSSTLSIAPRETVSVGQD